MGDAFLSVHFLTPFYAMGLAFFDNQKTDYIGDLSVRLQYFLIVIWVLLTIDLILLIILAATALGFIIPLPFTFIPWIVVPIGFLGCWRRNHILVLIYVMAGAASYFLLMLGMAIIVIIIADIATACGCCGTDCHVGHQFYIPTIAVYILFGICFVCGGIVLGIVLRTFTRYWKLRQRLVRAKRGAPSEKPAKKKAPADDPEDDHY